ncbi:MAG: carboxypeptidase regulatory-like domain-containing protein [Acidobacteria bacterium]|nr:carboxypeptidase regulatory-like domain-containing protein [Acidobacteriota bacterium]
MLADALVEVTAGSGAGLFARTGLEGRYRLYGVAGDTQVRVTKEGFQPRVQSVTVSDHQAQDFDLSLVRPREDLSEVYALTIIAAGSCRDALPEEIRTRSYTAHLTQDGPFVEARLSGAMFAVSRAGRGDHFRGRFEQDGVSFSLSPHIYKYYGYEQYPDVAEKLLSGAGYFVLDGLVVVTGTHARLSGTLSGSFRFFKFDPAWGGSTTSECAGGHEFVLSRVGVAAN